VALKTKQAFAVWITGLPASGKSTITGSLKTLLDEHRIDVAVLESDVLRKILSENPRYGESDRDAFYRQMIWIGVLLTRHGVPVIFDATANRRAWRNEARRQIPNFVEVFVDVPLETCIERDPKGIYRSAAAGHASDVPGMQAKYEPPESPELVIDGARESPLEAARRIVAFLKSRALL
jgi:adenylylsulfate kinase